MEYDIANPDLGSIKQPDFSLDLAAVDERTIAAIQIFGVVMPIDKGDGRMPPTDRIFVEHNLTVGMPADGDRRLFQLGSLARRRVIIGQQIRHKNRFMKETLQIVD
jgi:hypothetical protein